MTARAGGIALVAVLLSADPACAQDVAGERSSTDPHRFRVLALGPPPRGETDHVPTVAVERRTLRPTRFRGETPGGSFDARPRSRVTTMRIEDKVVIGERLVASAGWHGLKVANRNANATLGGVDRLTARDWFLPRAKLSLRPTAKVAVSLGYRETMRAYEGAGSVGAFGMTRDAFATLQGTLKPERARQWRLDGAWTVNDMRLSIGGFRAELRDPLGFADRSYRPSNGNSIALSGLTAGIERRVTAHLTASGSYLRATGGAPGARGRREDEISLGAIWTSGAWRGSVRAARGGSTMAPGRGVQAGVVRIESAIDYEMAGIGGRPLLLSARLTDPSRLASARLREDSGVMRAVDRARGMMLSATMIW